MSSSVPLVRVGGLRIACRPLATRSTLSGMFSRDAALRSRSCTLSTRRDRALCLTRARARLRLIAKRITLTS